MSSVNTNNQPRANKTDAGNGSEAICRVSNVLRSPSPDPSRSANAVNNQSTPNHLMNTSLELPKTIRLYSVRLITVLTFFLGNQIAMCAPPTTKIADANLKKLSTPKPVSIPESVKAEGKEVANFVYWQSVCHILDTVTQLQSSGSTGPANLLGSKVYDTTATRIKALSAENVDDLVLKASLEVVSAMTSAKDYYEHEEKVNDSIGATVVDAVSAAARAVFTASPVKVLSEGLQKRKEVGEKFESAQKKLNDARDFLKARFTSGFSFSAPTLKFS